MSAVSEWFNLTQDPLWPFSLPTFGWPALLLVSLFLCGMAVWSYTRAPQASPRRVGILLTLRLTALLLVFLAISGTSCISREDLKVPSLLLILVDSSESMSAVQDEVDRLSRWDYLNRVLEDCKGTIENLREEHNINVVFFRFGDDVLEFDPGSPGVADGKRTETALPLRILFDKYRSERYMRGLVILSDGADNVATDPPARALATQWRNLPCPIHAVTFGGKATNAMENDIVVTSLSPEPSVVAAKGKLLVRTTIDSLGRINDQVRVKVLLKRVSRQAKEGEFPEKELVAQDTTLTLRKDNLVQINGIAPADPGEYRLTVRVVHPRLDRELPGELSKTNNEMSTFLSVTREGVSVLLVERQERFPEPQLLLGALAADPRIRVDVAWLRGKAELSEEQKGLFQFDRQPYDVIILGDVTAGRLREADELALDKIHERVLNQRTGVMMLGGRQAFGNGDWVGTPLEKLLPVQLRDKEGNAISGQIDADVLLKPTPEGLKYLLRLSDRPEESLDQWLNKVQKDPNARLNGITRLGDPVVNAIVMAESPTLRVPLLVGRDYGTGRTLAFAGDTTHLWVRPRNNGKEAHSRFWRQAVLWLARQEDMDDNLRIRPDTRRIRTRDPLGFGVELRGKQGEQLTEVRYQVKTINEKGAEVPVDVSLGAAGARDPNEARGSFRPNLPGAYCIEATASGKDPSGKTVEGRSEAWIFSYQDEAETLEKDANPDFLRELAAAGGGEAFRPGELRRFLEQLPSRPLANPPPKPGKLPDWRSTRGPSPFLVAFFLLFVQLLTLEWFLRRRWGLV